MPNYVKSKIEFLNTLIDKQRQIIIDNINDKNEIDFNFLIPMPKELDLEESTFTSIGLMLIGGESFEHRSHMNIDQAKEYFERYDKQTQSLILDLGEKAVYNYNTFGSVNWYDFTKNNWGTKWNAGDSCVLDVDYSIVNSKEDLIQQINKLEKIVFIFQTAWSTPSKWLHKLASEYTDLTFKLEYADENTGYNCGFALFSQGQMTSLENDESHPDKKRWKEFAFYFFNGEDQNPESYGYDENWEYSEEIEENYYKNKKIAKIRKF